MFPKIPLSTFSYDLQICGNNESVKFLSEWLRLWYEKGSRNSKCSTDNDNWIMQGVDLNYSPTDSDSESTDEETSLKNVLLVTGPVGVCLSFFLLYLNGSFYFQNYL